MKNYFSDGPAAGDLLLNGRFLGAEFERLVRNDLLLAKCEPGNLYCLGHDLLFGTQDYWENVRHSLKTREIEGGFEVEVNATHPEVKLAKRKLIVSCKPEPKIEDIVDENGESELQNLLECSKLEHSAEKIVKCKAEQAAW